MSFISTAVNEKDLPPLWISALFSGPPKEEIAHYAAFGRFVAAFALAEAGAHVAVRHFSGLKEDIARVIFGGMRLTDLAKILRKLTANTEKFEETDKLLRQLDDVSQERDKLVHRLVEFDQTHGFRVTNELTVKLIENAEERKFSTTELNDLESDCRCIYFRFGLLIGALDSDIG